MADVHHLCPICGDLISDLSNSIQCTDKCKDYFHVSCVKIFEGKYNSCGKKGKKSWICARKDCEVRHYTQTCFTELSNTMKQFRIELDSKVDKLIAENIDLKNKIENAAQESKDVHNSLQFFNAEFEMLKMNIQGSLEKQIVTSNETKNEMEELKQYMRCNNLEIHGLPEIKDEDLYDVIDKLASKLNLTLNKSNVDIVHRIPTSKPEMPRPVVVKFTNRWKRDEFLKARKTHRIMDSTELGIEAPNRRIYINEHLTPKNKSLFKKARDMRPGLKYVWTRNCKIFFRETDNSPIIQIKNGEDITKLQCK